MSIELIQRARRFGDRVAIVDSTGTYSYAELEVASASVAAALVQHRGGSAAAGDLEQERVAFLLTPGFAWTAVQWGVWRAGGVAVPLAEAHPGAELARVLQDAEPAIVLADAAHRERLEPVAGKAFVDADTVLGERAAGSAGCGPPPDLEPHRRAMMIYTSGTTGRPKGVVTTHANIAAQVRTLVQAWEWVPQDRILHVLPLHHVHGVINVLSCALWAGATCEFLVPFDARAVWERFGSGELTLFMAVPTIYRRLIQAFEQADTPTQQRWSTGARRMRLMVSGSAALPVSTLERWEQITGQRLLERYGMTEIGMALGNPLHGERVAGTVGQPFPGVRARIVNEQGVQLGPGQSGEIEIQGPQVFLEYWRRPEETAAAFRDGWFRTGDEAVVQDGTWRIVGRRSVDIIKTGGYKVSALEIEETLRNHPAVEEVAVVGARDEDWGERVCAAIVPAAGVPRPDLAQLRAWCKERLAPYKAPRQVVWVPELPRNPLGKVLKPQLRQRLEGEGTAPSGSRAGL